MKGRQVVLGRYGGREAAALLLDGQLDDLLVAPRRPMPLPGAIYRALPDRPMKGQGGVMLRLPDGTAFLRQTRGITPGRPMLVQVTGYAAEGKAVPVTARLTLKGRLAIATPGAAGVNLSRQIRDEAARARLDSLAAQLPVPDGVGVILRSAAEEAEDDAILAEAGHLVEFGTAIAADHAGPPELLLEGPGPHAVAARDWPGEADVVEAPESFAELGVDAMVDDLARPKVPLSGGAWLSVEPTRAFVAVDVNTGGDTGPAAALKADIAAARALPRALRCRGLGGHVTVDFAPIPKRDRRTLEQALAAAFRADPVETALAGWTPLSHFELQRKRERLPVHGDET